MDVGSFQSPVLLCFHWQARTDSTTVTTMEVYYDLKQECFAKHRSLAVAMVQAHPTLVDRLYLGPQVDCLERAVSALHCGEGSPTVRRDSSGDLLGKT